MPSENDTVELNALVKRSYESIKANNNEIAQLGARLCQLVPPGTSMMLMVDVSGIPRLVTAGGQPMGKQTEIVHIIRPLCHVNQELRIDPRKPA